MEEPSPLLPAQRPGWQRWLRTCLVALALVGALAFIFARDGVRVVLPTFPTPTATSPADNLYRRPLHLASIAPGSPCPVAPGRAVNPALGPAIGEGPVYLVGAPDGTVQFAPPENFDSQDWAGQSTLYAVRPDYTGYVVLRGRQLDGSNEVRFGKGAVPPDSQQFFVAPDPAGSGGWTNAGLAYTRVRSDGCYAVQADGTTFSEVIVFQAHVASAPTA